MDCTNITCERKRVVFATGNTHRSFDDDATSVQFRCSICGRHTWETIKDVDSAPVRIVFDPVLFRPACAILQAMMGGNSEAISEFFDSETWLLTPTKDMRTYTGTKAQIRELAKKCENKHKEKKTCV